MKILILEDEKIASEFLKAMILDSFRDCEIVGIANSAESAVQHFNLYRPDLILMDINLGNHLSFELFENISPDKLNVIFITGYQEFALQAFKVNAIDYILKPVILEELSRAISKARDRIASKQALRNTSDVILVWENEKLKPLALDDIIKIKSEGSYSNFYLTNNKIVLTSKNLKTYELLLAEKNFVRIHRNCLINLKHVLDYKTGIYPEIKLTDDSIEIISRRRKNDLYAMLLNK